MASTRNIYESCNTIKRLQESTDQGRYILNVPGNGSEMSFLNDPQIIIQKYGANLRTNVINIESELKCMNRPLSADCTQYTKTVVPSSPIVCGANNTLFTEQSRVVAPAWWYREAINTYSNTVPTTPMFDITGHSPMAIPTRNAERKCNIRQF